jgi:hypothetical protein
MTEEPKRVLGFFVDSPYTYRLEIAFGDQGLAFASTAEEVEYPTLFNKPYIKVLLQRYYDALTGALEGNHTDYKQIVGALLVAVSGLLYPFVVEIRRKSNNAGMAYLRARGKPGKGRVQISDNMHDAGIRDVALDFLDALSLTLGLELS